nr:MAG TPA: hypothetical protein [Caudoviricetes sp.]
MSNFARRSKLITYSSLTFYAAHCILKLNFLPLHKIILLII